MVNLQIREELDMVLEDAAKRAGLSKEEFADEILHAHLEDESLPLSAFTETQLARLQESMGQVQRGEVVSSEEVDVFFESLFTRLASR